MSQNYASFWKRLIAAVIDGLILSVAFSLFFSMLSANGGVSFNFFLGSPFLTYSGGENLAGNLLRIGLSLTYYVLLTWQSGSTLGKRLMKIKVVAENGNKATFTTVLLREVVGKFVSTIVIGIGYLWVLFDAKKQGWHDKIAKTIVVAS